MCDGGSLASPPLRTSDRATRSFFSPACLLAPNADEPLTLACSLARSLALDLWMFVDVRFVLQLCLALQDATTNESPQLGDVFNEGEYAGIDVSPLETVFFKVSGVCFD